MGIWYCTREDVKSALDSKTTARNDVQVDRAIDGASRAVEGLTRRDFYPLLATRYFDWPDGRYSTPWRLWLGGSELITVVTLVVAGTTISASDYFLEPVNDGPPYTRLEIDLSSSAAFAAGDTHQRAIAITGLFGYSADEEQAGQLAEALDATETAVDVTDSAAIGVGHIIKADDERMVVTGKTMLDTGQNLGADLTAKHEIVTVQVTTGSAYTVGETILIDAERMLIVDIAGNNLIVRRAWDGSPLAAHTTGADIYATRTLTVTRGALGTTAATHNTATAITRHVVPPLVRQLAIAEALDTIHQEGAAYGRTVGSGDNEREAGGRALRALREQVLVRYGRSPQVGAV